MTQRFNHGHRVTWITPRRQNAWSGRQATHRATYIRGDKVGKAGDPEYIVKYAPAAKQPHAHKAATIGRGIAADAQSLITRAHHSRHSCCVTT